MARRLEPRTQLRALCGESNREGTLRVSARRMLGQGRVDGKALLGSTDGIPFADAKGRWEYDGKELILELTRTFEDVKSTFSTTRVFIGDVIALNDVPPQVQGAIKMTPSPTSPAMAPG